MCRLEKMFLDHMQHFHMLYDQEAREFKQYKHIQTRSIGSSLFVHPDFGEGVYWHYIIDEKIALLSVDMNYLENVSFDMDTMNMFCLGIYSSEIVRRYKDKSTRRNDTIVGHAWIQQVFHQSLHKEKDLKITSITFTPEAINKYAQKLGCSLYEMTLAFDSLDGNFDVFGLANILKDIDNYRPQKRYADLYYRTKIDELLIALLNSFETIDQSTVKSNPQYQRIIFEACSYIEQNLSKDLSTIKLAEKFYTSESGIIDAFRVVKKTTPQKYIRLERMQKAAELLKMPKQLTIAQVTELVGYKNQGAFSEAFKRSFGVTPSAYRKY